jgi:ribosomal-protein-alanine N-acetyltransferase
VAVAVTRLLAVDDAPVLRELLRRNRAFLAPWQPLRPDDFYTVKGQQESVAQALVQHEAGHSLPLVIVDHRADVAGTITLQSIIRGAFQSCSVGYWLAEDAQGRGLATQALRESVHLAFHDLQLHRVQAETLVHNLRSQRVLDRLDFARYGLAPAYLKIAGQWQDNLLYQLLTPAPELVGVA